MTIAVLRGALRQVPERLCEHDGAVFTRGVITDVEDHELQAT